ncbi:MAG TPA: type VI secretion system tip protein TssI/VgrG [Polyangia bacterium]
MALLGRNTSVTGPFPRGVLLLETLGGQEALGRPYVFELRLLSQQPNLDADDVLGKPLALGIKLARGGERFFHGIVTSFAKTGATQHHTRYAAKLSPLLVELGDTLDCRVFNEPGQHALSIVTGVLAKRGLTDVKSQSIKDHPYRTRDYCVQYRESDLNFVQRLLEEEGIYYYFRHEETKHTLVLADSITGHAAVEGYGSILYTPKEHRAAIAEEHFWGMRVRRALYPGRHTVLGGYDPAKLRPKQLQFGRATSEELVTGYLFEHYDYPGGLADPEEAQHEAALRAQVGCANHTVIEVEGNTVGLGVGDLVSLRKGIEGSGEAVPFWSEEDFAKKYLIVGASYSLSIDHYETSRGVRPDEPFKATYQLLDSHIPFRPQRTARKPVMGGPQTAVVVGPAGEEIWTDKLGRVMVQFDWDRQGQHNEKSSCWVRVAQVWAGAKWGALHIPRIGQEVVVRFLDGDPDRPVITGSVYSADHTPPYDLPGKQTQSGIKSRSSKGGTASNFNEIRFDDLKGHEELHLQAEKDMSTLVKHDQMLSVGADRSIVVGNNEATHVKANRQTTVNVNDEVVIGGTHIKTVTGPVTQIYGNNHARKVDGEQELFAEKNKDERVKQAYTLTTDQKFQLWQQATSMTFEATNVTVDAAGVITLTAGGATICIDETGQAIFDSPTEIKLVSGGSSLSILPGGIATASPAVTATAGAGSTLALGEETVAIKSKTVTLEADGVCSIKGKSKLKLQEAEVASSARGKTRKEAQKQKQYAKTLQEGSEWVVIKAVDANGNPAAARSFRLTTPTGTVIEGSTPLDGTVTVKGIAKGECKLEWLDDYLSKLK